MDAWSMSFSLVIIAIFNPKFKNPAMDDMITDIHVVPINFHLVMLATHVQRKFGGSNWIHQKLCRKTCPANMFDRS